MQNQMKSSTSSFPPIAMVKASSYEEALIAKAVERLFSELSISSALFEGKKVLIKPNLLMRRRPEEATTTHPQVVLSVIEWIKRAGAAEIVLADSPGGLYTPSQLRSIYSACGMEDVAKKSGCVLNLETGSGTVPSKNAKLCQEFNLIDPVRKADVIGFRWKTENPLYDWTFRWSKKSVWMYSRTAKATASLPLPEQTGILLNAC